ncbi:MAG: DUF5946 family protein [Pseudomonadota bacterium]
MTGTSVCPGCGAVMVDIEGPTHAYMISSAACYAAFTTILAAEYSDPRLRPTHRLSVDSFAVQHPGDGKDRRAIQSVGMHLVRLMAQREQSLMPEQVNDIMVRLGPHKSELSALAAPDSYSVTAADVAPFAGGPHHADKVTAWADSTLQAWKHVQPDLKNWAAPLLGDLTSW